MVQRFTLLIVRLDLRNHLLVWSQSGYHVHRSLYFNLKTFLDDLGEILRRSRLLSKRVDYSSTMLVPDHLDLLMCHHKYCGFCGEITDVFNPPHVTNILLSKSSTS